MNRSPTLADISTAEAHRRRAEELEAQLNETRELLDAIRSGEVDALVVGGDQVYTLKDADRPYRVLIEQMREGALTLSHEGVILYANHALAELLATPPETLVGTQLRRFLSPLGEQEDAFDRLLAGGKGELAMLNADGVFLPVLLSVSKLPLDVDGGQDVVCAVVTDLTDEKRRATELARMHAHLAAEAARREGEGFARQILESATDYAIIATDLDARVTTWNTGAEKLFGWSAHEITGQSADRIWTDEDRANGVPQAEMDQAQRAGRAEDERWHLRRDGSRFWASGLMMPLRGADDAHIGHLKILRDRSRTRAIEAALREGEARLRFTLQAGRLGAWELDLVTGELTTSETCRINFGRDAGVEFTYAELRDAVHPADRDRMAAAVERSIATGDDYDIDYRIVTPRGEERWVQIRARPVYAESGAPLRMAGVSLDISDRKRAEADLRRLNETLETRVVEEVAIRARAEEALRQSQKMEAVGQLTGGVAHDFNNLLTIIKSSTDLLRRPDLAEERRRRYVDAISDTVGRASKLTGQLLAFARRQALKPEVFDAAERVGAVTEMLRTIVGSRIEIEMDRPGGESCFVEADVSQFETALVNMAVNARDAMDGTGRLTISVASVPGLPPLPTPGEDAVLFVALRISDTGSSIAPDKLSHIFEPFYTTKAVGKGTGLGLSQVYGFAKQSGGDVAVESEVGRGSTFTLYLPRIGQAASDRAPEVRRTQPTAEDGRGRRVLVVEDNVEVGAFSTQLLQDLGYATTWAATGNEALKLLAEGEPGFDVVFSDVVMPGISGVELGLEIRRLYPDLPVVLTSGYSHVLAEEGRHGFELVHKPYAVEELSSVLRRVTRRHSARQDTAG